VRLTAGQLQEIVAILEKIDAGLICPKISGEIGRFLRQYSRGRIELDSVLARRNVGRREDDAISGQSVGAIEVYPLVDPHVRLLGYPLGELAEMLAVSEELGGLTNLVLWLRGSTANAVYNLLRTTSSGVRLIGDFRWTPPARLTPGEARLEPGSQAVGWQEARCLKAVADDILRPPHALEYVLDYRLGPPGLKYFRCITAIKRRAHWQVLPGLSTLRPLDTVETLLERSPSIQVGEDALAMLLIYREPWSTKWTIVTGASIEAATALAHSITWADFRRELEGTHTDAAIIHGLRESLSAAGVQPPNFAESNLTRRLVPIARDILCWLRGSN
jgi:hypothetical protein